MPGDQQSDRRPEGVAAAATVAWGDRGVSTVVGVALLLLVTVASVAALTAGVGVVVERGATAASVDRTAADLVALAPADRTGRARGTVHVGEGTLRTEPRTVRVLDADDADAADVSVGPDDVLATVPVDAIVYESGGQRVAAAAGGIVVGRSEAARFRREPRITVAGATGASGIDGSRTGPDSAATSDTVLVGLPAWNATDATSTSGAGSATLRMTVSHDRRQFAPDGYALSVETATPDPWVDRLEAAGASVDTRDVDGDDVPSVIARFPGEARLVVVVHDARLEVVG